MVDYFFDWCSWCFVLCRFLVFELTNESGKLLFAHDRYTCLKIKTLIIDRVVTSSICCSCLMIFKLCQHFFNIKSKVLHIKCLYVLLHFCYQMSDISSQSCWFDFWVCGLISWFLICDCIWCLVGPPWTSSCYHLHFCNWTLFFIVRFYLCLLLSWYCILKFHKFLRLFWYDSWCIFYLFLVPNRILLCTIWMYFNKSWIHSI